MKEALEKLVNAWYKTWLETHNTFEHDFEGELYQALPEYHFMQVDDFTWVLIGER